MAHSWSVKNSASQETFENLSDAEFVSFLTAIPGSEFSLWLAKRSDFPQWFSCTELPAFRLRRFGFQPIPTELAMTPEQIIWLERQLVETQAHARPATAAPVAAVPTPPAPAAVQSWTERRQHPRKDVKLQVVLISDNNAFRTFTRNISMGGMALEKPVPEKLLGAECTIFLSEPGYNHKFHFTGSVLAESSGPKAPRQRLVFGQMDAISRDALGRWIEAAGHSEKKAA